MKTKKVAWGGRREEYIGSGYPDGGGAYANSGYARSPTHTQVYPTHEGMEYGIPGHDAVSIQDTRLDPTVSTVFVNKFIAN